MQILISMQERDPPTGWVGVITVEPDPDGAPASALSEFTTRSVPFTGWLGLLAVLSALDPTDTGEHR